MDIREKAKNLLLENLAKTGGGYICPSWPHYKDQWLWDSCFQAIVCSELDLKDLAKNEIEKLLKWQSEDGWIPHQIYFRKRKKFDIERLLYSKKHQKFHSSITQPPVIAQAVEAINDPEWTQKILPNLVKFYLYFSQKQDPDGDGLISVCHPCESGRDTSPAFNFCQPFHPLKFAFAVWKLEWQYKKIGWDIDKIWQENLFNVEDVMFNCIWIDGLKSLCRLLTACGCEGMESAGKIKFLADSSEKAIYQLCWDENDKVFYNLDAENKKIKRLTVSGLFPLILENIPEKMRQALVERHLINPDEFWLPYPIPSAAKSDPAFDPGRGSYCNWRGPVWINMNWFIIRGLVRHGYWEIAEKIAKKTLEIVRQEGFREFYNPLTGKGLREPTKGFSWSTLAVTFSKIFGEPFDAVQAKK